MLTPAHRIEGPSGHPFIVQLPRHSGFMYTQKHVPSPKLKHWRFRLSFVPTLSQHLSHIANMFVTVSAPKRFMGDSGLITQCKHNDFSLV